MSGHNAAYRLGESQQGVEFDGKFLHFKSGVPSNGLKGHGKGALAIDSQSGKLYINQGTAQSATWSEVTGSGGAEHLYSKPGVAKDVADTLVKGKANLMVVGDSISNVGSTAFDTLHKGVIEHFKPNYWRGVYFEPPGSIANGNNSYGIHRINQNGANLGSLGDDNYMLGIKGVANDGSTDALVADLDHEIAGTFELLAFDEAKTTNITTFEMAQEALTGLPLDVNEFPNHSRSKLFENSSGVVDFFEEAKLGSTTTGALFGWIFVTSATAATNYAFATELKSRIYLNNSTGDDIGFGGAWGGHGSLTLSGITEEFKSRTIDWDRTADVSFDAGGNITANRYRLTLSQATPGSGDTARLVGIAAGFIGYSDTARPNGIRLNSITRGGAKTANFLLEPGDADIPATAGGVNFAFTDAALARRIGVVQANIVMIHLGANDTTVKSPVTSNHNPSTYVSELTAVMNRIQSAATTAGTGAVKFLVIGQYNPVYNGYVVGESTYSQAQAQAQHDNYAEINRQIINLTKDRTDMVYFDTEAYLNTTAYNTEGYETSEPTVMQLTAGYNDPSDDDNVHLNALGVDVIMSGLWSKISSLAT